MTGLNNGSKYKQRVDDEAKVDIPNVLICLYNADLIVTTFVKEAGIEVKTLEKTLKQLHRQRVSLSASSLMG